MGPQEETQFGPKALQDFCIKIFENSQNGKPCGENAGVSYVESTT